MARLKISVKNEEAKHQNLKKPNTAEPVPSQKSTLTLPTLKFYFGKY